MKHLLYILLAVFALTACDAVRYVPVESIRTEIEYRDRLRTDSVFVSDSVYIREKGDTLFVEHTRYAYRDRYVHDTAYIHTTDSVQVPYPVPTPLTRWQRLKQELGGVAMGALLIAIVIGICSLRRKT